MTMSIAHWKFAAAVFAVLILVLLWRATKSPRHPFDWKDLLMDQATNKGSLNAVIIIVMAGISIVSVLTLLSWKSDPSNLLLGILGVFVTGRAVAQGINAFAPPAAPSVTTTTSTETTIKSSDAPPMAEVVDGSEPQATRPATKRK